MDASKTVLLIAGYRPAAEWVEACLADAPCSVVTVADIDGAVRIMLLIEVDLIVAWPVIASHAAEEVSALADRMGSFPRPAVLIISAARPHGMASIDAWVKAPVAAGDLQERILDLLRRPRRRTGLFLLRRQGQR